MNMVTKKRKPYWNRFRDTSTFSRDQQAQNSCVGDSAYRWCLSTSTYAHAKNCSHNQLSNWCVCWHDTKLYLGKSHHGHTRAGLRLVETGVDPHSPGETMSSTSSWPLWPLVATSDTGGGVARWSMTARPTWNFLNRSENSATVTYLCGSSVFDQYCCSPHSMTCHGAVFRTILRRHEYQAKLIM